MDRKEERIEKINQNSNIRFADSKNAKSILASALKSEKKIDKLQTAVDELDEIEVLDETNPYSEEEMAKALAANNYVARDNEDEPLEEEKEEKEKKPKKERKPLKEILGNLYKKLNKTAKIVIGIVLALIIITLGVLFVRHEIKTHTYDIQIKGDEVVTLYEGGLYKESGYVAYNYKKENKTNLVKVDAQVDTDKVGEYEVTYTIKSIWKKNVVRRKVIVLKNPLDNIYFSLNGEEEMTINLHDEFVDPGFSIRSDDDKDYTKYVSVSGKIDNTKLGVYEIKYLIRINKKQQELIRKVKVVGPRYSVYYDRKATKDNVKVKVVSNIANFAFFMVGEEKRPSDEISQTYNNNGEYTVSMFDMDGTEDKIAIKINNIDREGPTGSCRALMSNRDKRTYFTVNAKDASPIASYKFNSNTYTSNSFTVNSVVSKGNVVVADEAGNKSELTCAYLYAPIEPGKNSSILYRFDGYTMKYWVEKASGTYLITHIWVEDPYNQLRVAVPKKFPSLDRASVIMSYASQKNGLYNKAMIGINGSGFVSDVFNTKIGKKYPKWKYSSKSPLVIVDGQILRNFTNLKMVGGEGTLTYGVKKNGYLSAYYLNDLYDKNSNITTAKRLINDGVKNTFAFGPYLVRGGKLNTTLKNIPDIRQAIGQIDKNNFVIVTTTVGLNNRISGLTLKRLGQIMYDLGCKEAYNTDGGGSTNLIYKNRNSDMINGIVTKSREVADVIYFVEK